ncbi:chromosome partitioning protein ParB [Novosphingobium sp. KCTC 2891]|uniref:ParB-like protein n=1 Tax=Novosphingobium sp. KCTC 2891 TaxID=2989730 RepID=UPI00222240FA|nr:ParB-like protein [Novosphingobium sp. KCTC 2891]MCW1383749.1 chromosome partitioning protein ParB [Novosphingobium sp. KCTC 2891]
MAMTNPIEPIVHPVSIRSLKPTQMTVGLREVERKRAEWCARRDRDGGEFLGSHVIPAVIGPKGAYWLIDHHHLTRALHEEGIEHVLVSVVARLDHLPKRRFYSFMDCRNWMHPYDAEGRRRDWEDLPRDIGKLADDPYRSLAGEVRRAGGYAKTSTPYSEFLWADFLRDRIGLHQATDKFAKAFRKALDLARSPAASHLPGFAGPEHGAADSAMRD